MKPWIIVLSSSAIAIAAAAAMAAPTLLLAAPAGVVRALIPLIPMLAVIALAVYALCAIVLTAGNLIVLSLHLRHRLTSTPLGPTRPDWTAALAASGLGRLTPLSAQSQPRSARPDGIAVLESRFRPEGARKEISWLCYIWAARTHFFSASIALAALVALGAAQQHAPLPAVPGLIPTIPAGLILVGLILLAILARLAIDVTVDPLIETIASFPAEPVDVALLRRAVELLEVAQNLHPEQVQVEAAPIAQIPDRLVGALEEGHHALSTAIDRLSASTDSFAATTRSSIKDFEKMVRAVEQRQPPAAETVIADVAELSQLRQAVIALTAALERVPLGLATTSEAAPDGDFVARRGEAQPELADQLRQLLQEVGAAS